MKSSIYRRLFLLVVFLFISTCAFGPMALAQGNSSQGNSSQEVTNAVVSSPPLEAKGVEISGRLKASAPEASDLSAAEAPKSENITLDFKEANIRDVLKIISYKSGVNIVSSPEVTGAVNVRITDVPWERALDVILKTYGYAYDRQGSIIMVAPLDKLTAQRKMEQDLAQVQPTLTEVVTLKYIDAIDARKAIEPQLSPRGKVTVLEITGQAGWGFGGSFSEKRSRTAQTSSRSKTLIVSDIPPVLDKIKKVLEDIDVQPRQILIETRLVEFDLNKVKDFGFDYATGTVATQTTDTITHGLAAGGHVLGGIGTAVTPAAFLPQNAGITAANTGLQLVFDKLSGSKFEVILHALEENVAANVLSAPSILTLDNQEATILVGEQFPIVQTTKSSDTSTTVDVSLQEYKDIGIQLNVVPQISGKDKDYINMILHPAVTTEGALIANEYPRITTREAQTQLLIKSGETVMIGGLIKEIKTDDVQGVPFLRKIPLIGKLFERKTINTQKINLIIFITAHIVDDKNLAAEQLFSLGKNLSLHPSGHR